MTDNALVTLAQKIALAGDKVGGKLKADKRNNEQNYAYISADKILAECGQALFEQGVAIIPAVASHDVKIVDRGNGKSRYDAAVNMIFKVTDGTGEFELAWVGLGSDYSVPDKAVYKAITSGHKYFISKLLCIGEGNEDSEHDDAEEKPVTRTTRPVVPAMPKPAVPQAEVIPTMTIDEAKAVTSSDGKAYGEIDTDTLGHMRASIVKSLNGAISAEKRADHNRKLAAIDLIVADRKQAA